MTPSEHATHAHRIAEQANSHPVSLRLSDRMETMLIAGGDATSDEELALNAEAARLIAEARGESQTARIAEDEGPVRRLIAELVAAGEDIIDRGAIVKRFGNDHPWKRFNSALAKARALMGGTEGE